MIRFTLSLGFEVDGIPVPYGDLEAPNGTLTGTLAPCPAEETPCVERNSLETRRLVADRGGW